MRIGRCFSGSDGRGGEEMSSNLRGEMGVLGGFVWMILALGEFAVRWESWIGYYRERRKGSDD